MESIRQAQDVSIEVRIRHLLFAHHEELITDEECQHELAILRHRGRMMHPIPLGEAVAKTSELAEMQKRSFCQVREAHTTSVLATERGAR